MGVDGFNEIPLPEPPLVDEPFATLSATDKAAMEASDNDDPKGASGSEYEEEEGDDDDE
jgi:hypothetical protein